MIFSKIKVFTFVIFLSASLQANIDLSGYSLKENQIKILRDFEAKGKYSEDWLYQLAEAMHNNNRREAQRQNMYIPSYTQDELEATLAWARGGAFSAYADFAGFSFDGESYRADCPNVALFRFGRASGTEFIPVDVMRDATNTAYHLQQLYIKDKENFGVSFMELAKKYGMARYLKPLNE